MPGAYHGVYITLGEDIDREVNAVVHGLASRLLEAPIAGVTDVIPGYANLFVEYDAGELKGAAVRSWAMTHLAAVERRRTSPRSVVVNVKYDGEDLQAVAAKSGLSVDEVIRIHSGVAYHVYAQGFTPGFPFMAEVDERIRLPRRDRPRDQVPVHSVAITGRQAGIYPLPSPGGWNLLGRTLDRVYDPHRAEPFLIGPGDEVRFVPGEGEVPTAPEPVELLPERPQLPVMEVVQPGLLDLVVDRGRFFAGRFGLARSGPLDARSAACANALAANHPDAPVVEINVAGGVYRMLSSAVLAFGGYGLTPCKNGEPLSTFASFALERADELSFRAKAGGGRGYLAIAGGVDSRRFMGSASVDVRGRIGRPLKEGDRLGAAGDSRAREGRSFEPYARLLEPVIVRLLPGPQASRAALHELIANTFTVQTADRMGLRLAGSSVPGGEVLSEAVPIGAVQVPAGGQPIILLNDRGTLGGYQKPALVLPADLPKLGQVRQGQRIRFRMAASGARD